MESEETPPGDRARDDQRMAEEADLRESLEGLSRLSTSNVELEILLTRVATYAVQAIPGADGAGLTLLEQDRPDTVVATAPFVTEIDDIQYRVGQGPCIGPPPRRGRCYRDRWAVTRVGRGSRDASPGTACTAWCPYR